MQDIKMTFKVFAGSPISEHATFGEAFKALFDEIMRMIKSGGMSWQVLETACWIEGEFDAGDGSKASSLPLYFPDARDFAIDEGILLQEPARIADPMPEVPFRKVFNRYAQAGINEARALLEMDAELKTATT